MNHVKGNINLINMMIDECDPNEKCLQNADNPIIELINALK